MGVGVCRHVPTLVLDLDDVLIHSEWTRGRGWRTFKRPGVEDFLKRMAPYYEMVVYTSQVTRKGASSLPLTLSASNPSSLGHARLLVFPLSKHVVLGMGFF